MEPVSILSLVISVCLIIERCFKHIKKSKCCGAEMETYEDTYQETHTAPITQPGQLTRVQSIFKKKIDGAGSEGA